MSKLKAFINQDKNSTTKDFLVVDIVTKIHSLIFKLKEQRRLHYG